MKPNKIQQNQEQDYFLGNPWKFKQHKQVKQRKKLS